MGQVRVGTASWTDRTLIASGWYPPGADTPEKRLRYYARQFSLVERTGHLTELFFDGIAVEPGDGAPAAGDGGPGAAAGFHVAGEAFDVGDAPGTGGFGAAGTRTRTGAGPARTPRGSGRCNRPGTQPRRDVPAR
jgi:hypothetical protein